jgi:mediator of RNA polymerase II transcription subunit 13
MDVLPPAIPFWETFGLQPTNGEKNIVALCIHPHNAAEGASAFLERLGLAYSSCNLGAHTRRGKSKKFDDGLVSWNAVASEDANYQSVMQILKTLCEGLGSYNFLHIRPFVN